MTPRVRVFFSRLSGLFGRRRRDRALDDEIQGHLDLLTDDFVSRGMSREDARLAARRALGRVEPVKEIYRDQRGLPIVDSLSQDLRFAVRMLARHRSFTTLAVGTLALGIGVNSTFFTLINAFCIRGLPIDRPDRVLFLSAIDARGEGTGMSHADFRDARDETTRFDGLAVYADAPMTLGDEGRAPDRVGGTYISAGAFRLLGRPPTIGREFEAHEDRAGAAPTVILSRAIWTSRYNGDSSIVGRTVNVNGAAAVVVGVMPDRFRFPSTSDVWLPLSAMPRAADPSRDARNLSVFGRLTAASSLEDARAELDALGQRLAQSYPSTNRNVRLTAGPINQRFNSRLSDPAWIAFTTAGILVLLVSCANVANLFVMRSTARTRELAIRTSMGATRPRIVRQLLVESTLLSALGGGLGLLLSMLASSLLAASVPRAAPLPFWIEFTPDRRVLAVVIGAAILSVFVCGLVPALQASGVRVPGALRTGGQVGSAIRTRRWMTGFLALEFALSLVLLGNVAIAVRGEFNWTEESGVDLSSLLTASVTPPNQVYRTPEERSALYAQIVERLRAIPGVAATTVASHMPLGGAAQHRLVIDDRPPSPGVEPPRVQSVIVTSGYFDTVGVAIDRGRAFTDRDGLPGAENVIVNQRLADEHFPGEDPLGRRIQLLSDGAGGARDVKLTIVGISSTVRRSSSDDGDSVVYRPYRAAPPASAVLLLRVAGDSPAAVAPVVREEVRRLDPNLPLYRVMEVEQALHEARWNGRVSATIVYTISTIAFVLALVGMFAVTAHGVIQRTPEIGLRIAVGAGRFQIVRLVLRRALVQLSIGLALGVVLMFLLQGIFPIAASTPEEAGVLLGLVVIVTLVAMSACIVPALRAARIEPVKALRSE